ncbi:PTS sugar transporter subunit IIB [Clostridium saccharobutylicum]|uniref:Lichenan-specific phosphotransferase enzyme IIB component n=1 Tax=Clostridium saccharobutylicum TaxID=169679 RepID=A0A1S8NBC3_CLOSA|nr:PTS sugar transporter subunit IIB [Clostridium saccharobutylicum]OOM13769.1 lichenan-specific phosphotransferase enzyme IIB component [Clostridium saccharobutylicum]
MNIYLVCNAGMSTSILVAKMQEAAKKQNIDVTIEAFSVEILNERVDDADAILLGPQIRHMLPEVEKIVARKCPLSVIDMRDYGLINGENVLKKAIQMINA